MGPVALDTGVVLAWFMHGDAHHLNVRERPLELTEQGARLAISTVTFGELMTSRSEEQQERAEAFADRLGRDGLISVDRDIARRAGELRRTHRALRTPDALIAATADVIGAQTLLTTDRSLARLQNAEYLGITRHKR